jgi:hypothetical protein
MFEILFGSVNILKHSTKLFLHVIEGSKRISLLFSLAMALAAFRVGVSEKFPCCNGGLSRFSFGLIRRMCVSASSAHRCGLGQPSRLSQVQSWHVHVGVGWCRRIGLGVRILSAMAIRSATVVMACRRRRHLAGAEVIARGIARGWYHAGSWVRRCGERRIAASCTLYFLAT